MMAVIQKYSSTGSIRKKNLDFEPHHSLVFFLLWPVSQSMIFAKC